MCLEDMVFEFNERDVLGCHYLEISEGESGKKLSNPLAPRLATFEIIGADFAGREEPLLPAFMVVQVTKSLFTN